MKNDNANYAPEENSEKETAFELGNKKDHSLTLSILASSIILASAWIYTSEFKTTPEQGANIIATQQKKQISELEEAVLPPQGIELPVVWGDLGAKLVNDGVIDADKFKTIYEQRGTFTEEYKNLLFGTSNGKLKMTNENSGYLLNLLWALGLGSKNPVLDTGEMVDPKYGGAKNFASTGGWSVAKGNVMDHYSRHSYFNLTPEQQALVDKISRGIYRPCCGNSTHFPDCNHGMAMLGLLELMASQGVSEQNMWKTALAVNSYWFPNNYLTIAAYMKNQGTEWKDADPREVLGSKYSSASGFRNISSQVTQPQQQSGGGSGCSIGTGKVPQQQPRAQQPGCGI